jgi:carbamoyl-phosphate synthase large subunit
MPKRSDLQRILILGAGPIVIGQACEFDYSGSQACRALKAEGYTIVLVNSNPATIMTDPELADRTYIEPLTVEVLEKILEQEKPQALLATLGGQTALNLAMDLKSAGILDRLGVELIGANAKAIELGEDRQRFKELMEQIGLDSLQSVTVQTLSEAQSAKATLGLPLIVRPAYTLGGSGGSVVFTEAEFESKVQHGLDLSPISQVLLEESALGWKEYEFEVMRDHQDNVVIVCSVENVDPMGVHTGDSITVAPAQTLTDREYQTLRDASLQIIRAVGVAAGGCNIQFAIHPETGRVIVIEMNPRVSRSSALVSKATGVPIAKISALLAVGYTLNELRNDMTQTTSACFEPAIDYVVTKIPRFSFDKFPEGGKTLSPQMKSVGEVMAIGRTFQESFQKALRGLEANYPGFCFANRIVERKTLEAHLSQPSADRLVWLYQALKQGFSLDWIYQKTGIDPWFLENFHEIVSLEAQVLQGKPDTYSSSFWRRLKSSGFSDKQIATLTGFCESAVMQARQKADCRPVYKSVDTCAGEFEAQTPYFYSTYDAGENEAPEALTQNVANKRVVILGGGPNRIGQGIEFDYCCVHAAQELKTLGYEAIMLNSNPETVSTDYDTSTRLYFEPLTPEDVGNLLEQEQPLGVIAQLGGQTPLKLARALRSHPNFHPLGTSVDSIDAAEDRERFRAILEQTHLQAPASGIARHEAEALSIASSIGYPVMVRPSYVLGGQAMRVVYSQASLKRYLVEAFAVEPDHPLLIDRFLEEALELDVDAVSDGETVYVGAILEHIEHAGIHSGDSTCVWPAQTLSPDMAERVYQATTALAKALQVKGLLNIQFAIKDDKLFILEVNPRASRTVPFVSKATGVPMMKLAIRVMLGEALEPLVTQYVPATLPNTVAVKMPVFPFVKFRESDPKLGPEMRSTGEVMGVDTSFAAAYAKAFLGAGVQLPTSGTVFLSVNNADKPKAEKVAKALIQAGYILMATAGTANFLQSKGLTVQVIPKKHESPKSGHAEDLIQSGQIQLVINTPAGEEALSDDSYIRKAAVSHNIAMVTTMTGALALLEALTLCHPNQWTYTAVQNTVLNRS